MSWVTTSFGVATSAISEITSGISGLVNALTPAVELGLGLAGAFGIIPSPSPAATPPAAAPPAGGGSRSAGGVPPNWQLIPPADPGLHAQAPGRPADGGGGMIAQPATATAFGIPEWMQGPAFGMAEDAARWLFRGSTPNPGDRDLFIEGGEGMPWESTTGGGGGGEGGGGSAGALVAAGQIVPLPRRNRFTGGIVGFTLPRLVSAADPNNPNRFRTYVLAPEPNYKVTISQRRRHHHHRGHYHPR